MKSATSTPANLGGAPARITVLAAFARSLAIAMFYPFILFSPIASGQFDDEGPFPLIQVWLMSGNRQAAYINAALADPLRVSLLSDESPIAGGKITWTRYLGSVIESVSETFTDADGIASLAVECGPTAGPRTVVASAEADGFETGVSFLFWCIDTAPNYSDLWSDPAEPGWALDIVHQGDTILATWLTYDAGGHGTWFTAIADRVSPGAFGGGVWMPFIPKGDLNTSRATSVGSFQLVFDDNDHGTISYNLAGAPRTKPINRFVFNQPVTRCAIGDIPSRSIDFQGFWHAGSTSALSVVHQGSTMIANWLGYDSDGKGVWLMAVLEARTQYTYIGPIYRMSGPSFDAVTFDPALIRVTPAGSMGVTFPDRGTRSPAIAYFAATVEGAPAPDSIPKTLVREAFGDPEAVCNQ